MTLVKFKNARPIDRYTGIPSIFSDFFNDFITEDSLSRNVFKSIPAVNISETPEHYRLEIAAPGMSKSDFKIEVENGCLLYTSDAADERSSVDLGGRRIIKKKNKKNKKKNAKNKIQKK